VDGALLAGPRTGKEYAKFTLKKGLPTDQRPRAMAIENTPHSVDDFDGVIKEGYGKGEKRLVYSGNDVIKVGGSRQIGRINGHEHDADRAGLHYDFVAEGVDPHTRAFEVNIPNGVLKGRYAFRQAFEKNRYLVVRMKDESVLVAKPDIHLKPKEFLATIRGMPTTVEWKADGCFTGEARVLTWNGELVRIKDIVDGNQDPILVGLDKDGKPVPTKITNRFNNGKKTSWIELELGCQRAPRGGSGFGKRPKKNRMVVTPNHHILIDGKYAAAETAKKDSVITTIELQPPDELIQLMRSGLLGDGSISKDGSSWSYQEGHKRSHLNYVAELRGHFGNCGVMAANTTSGFGTRMCWLKSRAYKCLGQLRSVWYPSGKKRVPQDLSWFNDRVVAKWFMDDGSRTHTPRSGRNRTGQRDRAIFSTHGFPKQDVERLSNKLQKMYGVSCSVEYSKGWYIRINAGRNNEIAAFWKRIAPYVFPLMRYKLPEKYRPASYIGLPAAFERLVAVDAHVSVPSARVRDMS
jgi:hypothetical protein